MPLVRQDTQYPYIYIYGRWKRKDSEKEMERRKGGDMKMTISLVKGTGWLNLRVLSRYFFDRIFLSLSIFDVWTISIKWNKVKNLKKTRVTFSWYLLIKIIREFCRSPYCVIVHIFCSKVFNTLQIYAVSFIGYVSYRQLLNKRIKHSFPKVRRKDSEKKREEKRGNRAG